MVTLHWTLLVLIVMGSACIGLLVASCLAARGHEVERRMRELCRPPGPPGPRPKPRSRRYVGFRDLEEVMDGDGGGGNGQDRQT